MSLQLNSVDEANKNWLPWQCNGKTDFMLIICSHSSTNPENLAKISLADVEMIGLKGFVKTNK